MPHTNAKRLNQRTSRSAVGSCSPSAGVDTIDGCAPAPTANGKALGITNYKINLEMIAAFLTLFGYSLNDTIVVFDRIRENRGKGTELTPKLINDSINQTLSRTILTSFTTLIAILCMYIWGGTGLRGFTFIMLFGILIGTYSSIYVALPVILLWGVRRGDEEATPLAPMNARP